MSPYRCFRCGGREFPGLLPLIAACEAYAAKQRRPWSAGVFGVPADVRGDLVVIGRADGSADGRVVFEDLEPAEGGGV